MANSYRKLWQMYEGTKKLGVTATPWRMNNSGFCEIYDKLILSKTIKEFIQEGWLSPYNYYSIKETNSLAADINNIDEFDVEGDYKISALEGVVDTSKIRAQLLESYSKYAKGKKGIIYSISRKHSDHICAEFKQAGVNIVRIDSQTPREERRLYVKRFKAGLIDIIVNVDIFSEGFDCPDIEFIQLARPTKSLVKYLQQVGRGLRPTEGKTRCLILDNVGLHMTFGLPDSDQTWEEYFVGDPSLASSRKRVGSTHVVLPKERPFDEGDDDMCLIDGVVEESKPTWTEDDDVLLKTLFLERMCPESVIAMVFHKEESEIKERINVLNLLK